MKRSLEPDEWNLRHARYRNLLKPCPFCGREGALPMDTMNDQPLGGGAPIYGCTITCSGCEQCMGSVHATGRTRDEARVSAVEKWQRRVPAPGPVQARG